MATDVATMSLQDEVNSIRWWHTIDLGHGVVTKGGDRYPRRASIRPACRPTWRIGASSISALGTGSFRSSANGEGAKRVVALDHVIWNDPSVGRRGFDLARRTLGSKVEDVDCEVHAMSPEKVGGVYDLVLFLGVLYHVQHPLLVLQNVASVCGKQLILETHVDMEES